MRSTIIFSIVSLLAQQALPASAAQVDSANAFGSHSAYLATKVRRNADIELNASGYLRRRIESYDASTAPNSVFNKDAAPAPSGSMNATMPMTTASGPLDLNPTMNNTQAACLAVLANATSTDQSGMAACFNINFFDNTTGSFQANMLIYKLASVDGAWNNATPGTVQLQVNFPAAMVGMSQNATSVSMAKPAATSAAPVLRRRASGPTLMEAYMLMGTVSAPFADPASLMNATLMRKALTPMISISAKSADTNGTGLATNLTAPAGAAFVSGWFSDADITMRQAVAAAAANPPPFVLPGVTLAIPLGLFPIGLIVTSIWVGLFVGALGYGTLGRMQWRKAYRAQKPGASGK